MTAQPAPLHHGPPSTDWPHVCEPRIHAGCADCGLTTMFCTATAEIIAEILAGAWRCDGCLQHAAEDEDTGLPAALVAVLLGAVLAYGAVWWLATFHLAGKGW